MALFILTACSGTGKSTLISKLRTRHPRLKFSVSHTTRAPRVGEEDGVAYHFVNRERFEEMIKADAFVEWAQYAGNLYGTSHQMIRQTEERGDDLIFDVEVLGAAVLKKAYPQALTCFILPPSWKTIEERLRGRETEDEETIQRRLIRGHEDLQEAHTFDYLVINDQLEEAVNELTCLYQSLKLKTSARSHHLKRLLEEIT